MPLTDLKPCFNCGAECPADPAAPLAVCANANCENRAALLSLQHAFMVKTGENPDAALKTLLDEWAAQNANAAVRPWTGKPWKEMRG